MFDNFTKTRIKANGVYINLVHGGVGRALLLLHGYPQTHVEWHKIAPKLAEHYIVVAPDLRGYGDSEKPPAQEGDLSVYCKRTTAQDQVEVMEKLGFESFHVVGHDRGARVGHRMALDHPERVRTFTSLDVVPSQAAFDHMDSQLSFAWFHWHLMRQPSPLPETLIGNSAKTYLDFLLERWTGIDGSITEEAYAEYLRCFNDPETIRATCLDYRGSNLTCSTMKAIVAANSPVLCCCSGAATWRSVRVGRPVPTWICSLSGGIGLLMCVENPLTVAIFCPKSCRKRRRLNC